MKKIILSSVPNESPFIPFNYDLNLDEVAIVEPMPEAVRFEKKESRSLSLFGPMDYAPTYAYPLVVWFHSDNETERELLRIMPLLSMRNYVGVAPQGYQCSTPTGGNIAWPLTQSNSVFENTLAAVRQACAQYRINKCRVFLAGLDSGGTMALSLALSNPTLFAGAASFNGPLPVSHKMFAQLMSQRKQALYLATTQNSTNYPVQKWSHDMELLTQSGLSAVFREFRLADPSLPDRSNQKQIFVKSGKDLLSVMMSDLNRWIMRQFQSVVF